METSETTLSPVQSPFTTPNLNHELFYGNKKLNINGIPKSINDLIMTPMKKDFMYKDHYMKAAPGIFKTKQFKNTNPLFILKLHFYLRVESEHMEIFERLTDNAWEYIQKEIRRFSHPINAERWDKEIFYIKKLNAYKNLLYYLRHEKTPTKMDLDKCIQSGIYGARKGKDKSKRAKIDYYAAEYVQDNEESYEENDLEFRINAD